MREFSPGRLPALPPPVAKKEGLPFPDMTSTSVRDDQLPRGAGQAAEVTPIAAASVLLFRGDSLDLLMMRRHEGSSFVPGAWVFPGGVVDPPDRELMGNEPEAIRLCAVRELFEETGIYLGEGLVNPEQRRSALASGAMTFREVVAEAPAALDSLVLVSHWVTPVGVPKRFDTWFFAAVAPPDATPTADLTEGVELVWIAAAEALRRHAEGSFALVFPTIRNLEAVASFSSSSEFIERRRGETIPVTRPVLVIDGKSKRIILPDE